VLALPCTYLRAFLHCTLGIAYSHATHCKWPEDWTSSLLVNKALNVVLSIYWLMQSCVRKDP